MAIDKSFGLSNNESNMLFPLPDRKILKLVGLVLVITAVLFGGFFIVKKTAFFHKILKREYIEDNGVYIEGIHQQNSFQILQGKVVEVDPKGETLVLERDGKREMVLFQGGGVVLRIVNEKGKGISFRQSPFSEIKIGDEAVFNDIRKTENGWEAYRLLINRRQQE